jgi:hypothetical protein
MQPLDIRSLETPSTVWIKRAAAVGLAMAFFLPLTSCSGMDYSASSAYEWPSIGACAGFFLFFWPIGFEVAIGFRAQPHPALRSPRLRIVLVACTALGISWLVYWGQQVRYGAFVAYLSSVSYGAVLWALVARGRRAADPADRPSQDFRDGE